MKGPLWKLMKNSYDGYKIIILDKNTAIYEFPQHDILKIVFDPIN